MVKREREEEEEEEDLDVEKRVQHLKEICSRKTVPKFQRIDEIGDFLYGKLKYLRELFVNDIEIECTDRKIKSNKALWDKFHFRKEGFADPEYKSHFKACTIRAILDDFFEEIEDELDDNFDLEEYARAVDYFGIHEEGILFYFEAYCKKFGKVKEKMAAICNSDHRTLSVESMLWVLKSYTFSELVEFLPYLNKEALEKLFVLRENLKTLLQ